MIQYLVNRGAAGPPLPGWVSFVPNHKQLLQTTCMPCVLQAMLDKNHDHIHYKQRIG